MTPPTPPDESGPLAPDPERLAARLRSGERPYVTLKAAATLDGRIATRTGESQWITGPEARAHAMRLRAGHDAVLVGRLTVDADDPQLTVRPARPGIAPARVVLDSRAGLRRDARVLAADGARRLVVCGSGAADADVAALEALGVEVLRCGTPRPEPAEYLARLRAAGLRSVLVEGGGQVHAGLIAQGAADELFLYIAGLMIGDPGAPGWCGPLEALRLADAPRVRLDTPQRIGDDVLLHGWFDGPP